jgi:hypothetical protein
MCTPGVFVSPFSFGLFVVLRFSQHHHTHTRTNTLSHTPSPDTNGLNVAVAERTFKDDLVEVIRTMAFLRRKLQLAEGSYPTIKQLCAEGKFGNQGTAGRWRMLAILPEPQRTEFLQLVDEDNRLAVPKLNISNIVAATNPDANFTIVTHTRCLVHAPTQLSKEDAKVCAPNPAYLHCLALLLTPFSSS